MLHTLEKIKNEHDNFLKWVETLKGISNKTWSNPYSEGKWSPSEIIAHLMFWDRFLLNLSIIDVQPGDNLPNFPPVQEENERAAKYARETKSKDQLIDEFLNVRKEFVHLINELNEDQLYIPFKVGNHDYTVISLLEDFQGHDKHHQVQIQSVTK
ncbi:DinB family protein [Bacillus suaedaesalsae]|uniref:DinB family protein n=1 Tax=Bacillus suaedaesalsae TaxID=2810349 RepID=A0ABS2DGU8_9BACI|nr:DinB family protein [Bacillus suaedaesalsae]MBM6617652.1 DinB family protein [Bacillus suaedaesalsae]